MDEQEKREREIRDWEKSCERAMTHTKRQADMYIDAKIYDRNMKSGFFKVRNKPLEKGMAELLDYTESAIQNNGNNGNTKEKTKKKSYHDIL